MKKSIIFCLSILFTFNLIGQSEEINYKRFVGGNLSFNINGNNSSNSSTDGVGRIFGTLNPIIGFVLKKKRLE